MYLYGFSSVFQGGKSFPFHSDILSLIEQDSEGGSPEFKHTCDVHCLRGAIAPWVPRSARRDV